VTMHAVLGDGEMTRRELTETLGDLWKADEENSQSYWFLLQGKSEPTDTDKALVLWLEKNEIYYELVTDDPEAVSEVYTAPQEVHTAKKLAQKVVALMQSKPEEGEPAEVLALFADVNDATAAEDRWLNGVIQAAYDAGFPTRALNDGLVEIDLSEGAAEAEVEPEETPVAAAPAKKAAAKKAPAKAAARPAADTPIPDEDEVVLEDAGELTPTSQPIDVPTREELEDMEPSEIKEVAAAMGIVLPPRTRATTYIDHILGEAKAAAPTAEVSEVPEVDVVGSNGLESVDVDVIAERVAVILWEKVQKAVANV
jgi:hypothetical protein